MFEVCTVVFECAYMGNSTRECTTGDQICPDHFFTKHMLKFRHKRHFLMLKTKIIVRSSLLKKIFSLLFSLRERHRYIGDVLSVTWIMLIYLSWNARNISNQAKYFISYLIPTWRIQISGQKILLTDARTLFNVSVTFQILVVIFNVFFVFVISDT